MVKRLWWRDTKGFTLLECLIALLLIGGLLVTADGVIRHLKVIEPQLTQRSQREWETCILQLEAELSNFHFSEIKDGKLHVWREKDGKIEHGVISHYKDRNMLRVSIKNGYEPILTEIKQVGFEEQQHGILITVKLLDGTTQQGWWIFD